MYRALRSRDSRFDGQFFVAVTSTGVYCRPSCPAITPKRENVRFYATAAAAQNAGFRACLRCNPHAAPGSPEWNRRGDLAARAVALIADGVVDREGVAGLARRLAYSERHLHRQLLAELGAGPLALARAQRAQVAGTLIETGGISLRLAYRAPLEWQQLLRFLAARAVAGVEHVSDGVYRRTLRLPRGHGVLTVSRVNGYVRCDLRLADLRDLAAAVGRCRRLLDLDADPAGAAADLARDELIGPLLESAPGLRVPGTVDGAELALRAVIGQQVSVAAARTAAARLTRALGEPIGRPDRELTHLFPSPSAIAEADPARLAGPWRRRRTLRALATALASGEIAIDPGGDRDEIRSRLLAIPGIGPWTAEYIAMRALADPDAFLASDLGVRRALARLGRPTTAKDVAAIADRWRPWRAYALAHLWRSGAG
jgi:AraC family transcriptional regulator of adaptative response / DNA-3-methyladenine glycosylase II